VKKAWLTAVIIVVTLLPVAVHGILVARTQFFSFDFRAFYCAARVASHGADPYLSEPLRSCESAIPPQQFYRTNKGVTVPAPLPGYAIAFVWPLALLPFGVAAAIWTLLLFVAWLVCVATIVRFARITWQTALAITSLSLGVTSIPLGEVVPLALAAICAAAYFAWQGRWIAAAIAAAFAMLEPHIGLPTCIALAIWAPATRIALATCFVALAGIALIVLGPNVNQEYFFSVLPAHALSEATRDTQYSLTAVLTSFGVGSTSAIRAGTIWYTAMVVIGTMTAGALARRTNNRAFLVCAPPAFAVLGGTFIHVTQLVAAIPATVLLANYASGAKRTIAVVALLLLSVPWTLAWSPALGLAAVFPVAYLAWIYSERNIRFATAAGVLGGLLVIGVNYAYLPANAPHSVPRASAAIDPKLAESSWSMYARKSSTNGVASWAARAPTWAGLILILATMASASQ
jgi:hypothetical protein